MTENLNLLKEDWYKNTITWKVAKNFKDIISKNWENILLKKNTNSNQILNEFEYNGRKLSTWTVYQNSEVWDFDIWEWINCISLWDITVCPKFFQAVKKVEKDEWINFYITESIWLNDCLIIAWKKEVNFKEIAEKVWLRNRDSINIILVKIKNDIATYFEPEFPVKIDYINHELYIQAYWKNKQAIIDKSPLFTNKLKKVAEYFENNMDKIVQLFRDSSEEDQKKDEKVAKEQKDRLNNLQNQL